jgi:hypothetical protein
MCAVGCLLTTRVIHCPFSWIYLACHTFFTHLWSDLYQHDWLVTPYSSLHRFPCGFHMCEDASSDASYCFPCGFRIGTIHPVWSNSVQICLMIRSKLGCLLCVSLYARSYVFYRRPCILTGFSLQSRTVPSCGGRGISNRADLGLIHAVSFLTGFPSREPIITYQVHMWDVRWTLTCYLRRVWVANRSSLVPLCSCPCYIGEVST